MSGAEQETPITVTSQKEKPQTEIDSEWLSQCIKGIYANVACEPIPESMMDLLKKIEKSEI